MEWKTRFNKTKFNLTETFIIKNQETGCNNFRMIFCIRKMFSRLGCKMMSEVFFLIYFFSGFEDALINRNFDFIFVCLPSYRVLTRILKVGVRDSLFVKSRNPTPPK